MTIEASSGIDVKSNRDLKLHLVTMVRNEADICTVFLSHATGLFDNIHIVDHQSTDGTRSIIENFSNSRARIDVYDLKIRGYHQSEISTLLARLAFRQGADWVFFLDADEFIEVENRKSLEAFLKSFRHDIMNLRWMNMVPTTFGEFVEFDAAQPFRWNGNLSHYGKAAIAASFVARHPNFYVHQGNHAVSPTREQAPAPMQDGCRLQHVPVRSLDRLRYKLAAGVQAYRAKGGGNSTEGYHWFELYDRIERGVVTTDWINGVVAQYGEPVTSIEPVNPATQGWEIRHLPETTMPHTFVGSATSLAETISADSQQMWSDMSPVAGAPLRAELIGREIKLRPQPMFGNGSSYEGDYDCLPIDQAMVESFDHNQLADALQSSCEPIDTIVPTAWAEHVPALFALFTLLRPRRYVELGSHRGMSFFAACQAAERINIGTQCVAIDGWVGDEHAGFYGSEIFDEFRALLRARHPNYHYIRSYFEHAAHCFAPGSIDLLHIDGLHTYEAVQSDYETWLPKMSSRGVIIFHDTNVYENGFGVWRLWNELTKKHPHFHLPHCHGLGIIYVGSEPSPMAHLLRRLEQDEATSTVIVTLLAAVGAMSVKRSLYSTELRAAHSWSESEQSRSPLQSDGQATHTTMADELENLRSVNSLQTAEINQLRVLLGNVWGSTSWKLTRPMRVIGRTLKQKAQGSDKQ